MFLYYNQIVVSSGDSLTNTTESAWYHSGQRFSAKDRDQDSSRYSSCAQKHEGAWWFNWCFRSHLNGRYINGGQTSHQYQGIVWETWRGFSYSLKSAEMKIKPSP